MLDGMEDPVWALATAVAVLGCGLELGAYFLAPWLLARLAFLPVGEPRRVPMEQRSWEALSSAQPQTGGYREAATRTFDLGRLRISETIVSPDAVGRLYPARGFATARLPYRFTDRVLALARIDITGLDGVVELRARFVPLSWPTTAVLVVVGLVALATSTVASPGRALAFGAFFVGLNFALSYAFSRSRIAAAVDDVEAQLARALSDAGRGRLGPEG
jgi:hypothetical protein